MVVSAFPGKLHPGSEPDFVQLEPRGDVFEKKAGDDRYCQVEQVVHSKHRLHEIVLSRSEAARIRLDDQAVAISLHAEPIESRRQEILSLLRLQVAARRSQVLDGLAL